MKKNNIPVLRTYLNVTDFEKAYNNNEIDFPVFLKPRLGAGSVHSFSANNMGFVKAVYENYKEDFIVQEFNNGNEYGVDIYVDFLSKKVTSIFIKKKLRMRAGETEKSVSIRNETINSMTISLVHNPFCDITSTTICISTCVYSHFPNCCLLEIFITY